jgi:L-rhamnose isomerase / sugar isomerase
MMNLVLLEEEFGVDRVRNAIQAVKNFKVEIPSWIFGRFGGGRFGEYSPPGAARDIREKLDDAAYVNKLTDTSPTIAMHVLWDFTKDGYQPDYNIAHSVDQMAKERGLSIGSISPTYFLRGSFRGTLSAQEFVTVERYIDLSLFGARVAQDFGTKLLTIWLPDGSLYPGQLELRAACATTKASLKKIAEMIDKTVLMLIEYKLFEPGTYHTVIADWGMAYQLAKYCGPRAGVLVDLGHHAPMTNIAQIVAQLIDDGLPCGFHFNTRYAADDDHSVEPNSEMARIFYELVQGQVICNPAPEKDWAYMIDQCSGRENRIHAILHTIDSLQLSLAKAMLVDTEKLSQLQKQDEVILANRFFNDALLNADVRPILATARHEKNLPVNPIASYVNSGYQKRINDERK